jgi:hypothetical protein
MAKKPGRALSGGRLLGQQLPYQICDLARRCDRRDVEAFAVLDPVKEGTQRPRNRRGRPGSFNQHRSGNCFSLFRDAATHCAIAGLAHPPVSPSSSHAGGRRETGDVADGGYHRRANYEIHSGNRHHLARASVVERNSGNGAI